MEKFFVYPYIDEKGEVGKLSHIADCDYGRAVIDRCIIQPIDYGSNIKL